MNFVRNFTQITIEQRFLIRSPKLQIRRAVIARGDSNSQVFLDTSA